MKNLLLTLVLIFSLTSCSSETTYPTSSSGDQNEGGSGLETKLVSGNVIDGPLQNAKVYLDLDGSGNHNDDEPFSMTDANGNYELNATKVQFEKFNILAEMTDETIDTETNQSLGAYTMSFFSPDVQNEFAGSLISEEFSINAFTSMIQDEIQQGVSPDIAVKNIGILLGLEAEYYRLLLIDFWAVKQSEKINGVTVEDQELVVINRLHNIARVYVRVLSGILGEITENKSYSNAQKGYATHIILDALKHKLKNIMSTADNIADADILAEELKSTFTINSVTDAVDAFDENNIKPNVPNITNDEDMYSLEKAKSGIDINWKMYYGQNGNTVKLKRMPENTVIDTVNVTQDTPNMQFGKFTVLPDTELVYSYRVCLNNDVGEVCSSDYKFSVVEQIDGATATDNTGSVDSLYPLIPSGEPKYRPAQAKWDGWMQGVVKSKFVTTGTRYNAGWSKWSGLIADKYEYLRCYMDVDENGDSINAYVCDNVVLEENFERPESIWDHYENGNIIGKAGGQAAKVATDVAQYNPYQYYKIVNGVEKGIAYIHQVRLCRMYEGEQHCSVSDPLKLYVTQNGSYEVTSSQDGNISDPDNKSPVKDPLSEDANTTTPNPDGVPNQDLNSNGIDATKQTPIAAASLDYIEDSWKEFDLDTEISISMTKWYGNPGTHYKFEAYKYNENDTIDTANLVGIPTIEQGAINSLGGVAKKLVQSESFSFANKGIYVFKGYLCNGVPSTTGTFCQPSANTQKIYVGMPKTAATLAPTGTAPIPTYVDPVTPTEPLVDAEYAKLEKEGRGELLKAAIERIVTIPTADHEKDEDGNDIGPDLSKNYLNVIRVQEIFSDRYDVLKSKSLNDFTVNAVANDSGTEDFNKGKLAWEWLFPMANGHIKEFPLSYAQEVANGEKYPYTYKNFLKAVAKYPNFCGDHDDFDDDNADTLCQLSMSMMFAHFAQEVGGHIGNPNKNYIAPINATQVTPDPAKIGDGGAMKEFTCNEISTTAAGTDWCAGFEDGNSMVNKSIPEYRQALYWVNEAGCSEDSGGCEYRECAADTWQGKIWPCPTTTKYFGRGPKQLSYNYNYGLYSDVIYGDVKPLLVHPENVTKGWLAFGSAVFFFMQPRPPKPSMYELVYGYWTLPTTDDIDSNKLHPSRGMGGSIMIINGGVECGGSKAMAQAENRVKYYTGFLDYFNMTDRIDLADRLKGKNTCMEMQQFGPEHGVTYPNSWVGDWTGTCKLRSWDEGYSGFIDGHFKKCFEDKVLNK